MSVVERSSNLPSPFAFNLLLQGYVDILKIEDRVAFVRRMHEMVLEEINGARGGAARKKDASVLPTADFSYERLWEKQKEDARKKEEDFNAYLHEQLRAAARRIGLDADLYYHAGRLIDGEMSGYPDSFKIWLRTLVTGTVPSVWKDDLVRFFKEKERIL